MANITRKLKLTREALAQAFDNDMQAIKAMEGLQAQAFDGTPEELVQLVVRVEQASADALQAVIIANQYRPQPEPYLNPVSVPIEQSSYLQPI